MNPIIDTLIGGNNPMESLNFYWMAEFNNGVIFQFEDGKEHKFQEVLNRMNELEYFHLYHKDGLSNINFIVDLKKGFIKTLDSEEPEQIEKKENIRLIYFRRIRKILNEQLQEVKCIIHYHLGFQYNDKNGNNRQIVLIIDNEGNWVLEG
jgi:hypothetical protein